MGKLITEMKDLGFNEGNSHLKEVEHGKKALAKSPDSRGFF
jgi:hypothetical protein